MEINNEPVDPEGEVVIIDFPETPDNDYTLTRADFTSFNDRSVELCLRDTIYTGKTRRYRHTRTIGLVRT